MLLKIKFHGPEEKPAHSCKVIAAMKYHQIFVTDYSKKYNAWNVSDEDEDRRTEIGDENMVGWIYSEELFWQIVNARREAKHETQ